MSAAARGISPFTLRKAGSKLSASTSLGKRSRRQIRRRPHLFDPGKCARFVDELASVLRPGGRCYLHEFAVEFPVANVPRQVTDAELRRHFTPEKGWRVLTIRAGEFLSRIAPVPATLACVEYGLRQKR
jgi:hypothetical protein